MASLPSDYIDDEPIEKDNTPGLLIGWNDDAVDLFIEKANIVSQRGKVQKPSWINFTGGSISRKSFKTDLINTLRAGGGESFDLVSVASNSFNHFVNVIAKLTYIQHHPFMQAVMKEVLKVSKHVGPIAMIGVLRDHRNGKAESLELSVQDHGYVTLFR